MLESEQPFGFAGGGVGTWKGAVTCSGPQGELAAEQRCAVGRWTHSRLLFHSPSDSVKSHSAAVNMYGTHRPSFPQSHFPAACSLSQAGCSPLSPSLPRESKRPFPGSISRCSGQRVRTGRGRKCRTRSRGLAGLSCVNSSSSLPSTPPRHAEERRAPRDPQALCQDRRQGDSGRLPVPQSQL